MVFGGDGVFDEVRSVVKNKRFFVSSHEILSYFDNLQIGKATTLDFFYELLIDKNIKFKETAILTFSMQ